MDDNKKDRGKDKLIDFLLSIASGIITAIIMKLLNL